MPRLSFSKIYEVILNYVAEYFYQIILFEVSWWWIFGIIGGSVLTFGWALKKSVTGLILRTLGLLVVSFQPLLYFAGPALAEYLWSRYYIMPGSHLLALLIGAVCSSIISFFVFRYLIGVFDQVKNSLIRKSGLERDHRSDIRNVTSNLPKSVKSYSPEKFFIKGGKKVFVGMTKKPKPNYISSEFWRRSHVDIIGTTGSGKGVLAGILLTQSILQGESVVVVDPKNDEWLPHVLGEIAKKNNMPYFYIDLNSDVAQWNPFRNKANQEIEELIAAGFGLSERGTDADFYRLNDRRSARLFANQYQSTNKSLPEFFAEFVIDHEEVLKDSPKFTEDFEELISLPVTHARNGLDLAREIEKGAVIYVRGSIRSPRILKLQKMFVLSVMQACENRDRHSARHVCLFLDEFKYLISKPSLEALGAIRDKRAHVILAHQSLGDLKDCPQDIDPESVVASVNENCAIKIAYKVRDPDTADWLARMSGKILVDDEMRSIKTAGALAEVKNPDRFIRQAERCLIDTNMLQSLPDRCAVIYGNGLADYIFTSPVKVKKQEKFITPTIFDSESTSKTSRSVAEDLLDVG